MAYVTRMSNGAITIHILDIFDSTRPEFKKSRRLRIVQVGKGLSSRRSKGR